ncbi:MAG: LytR/AlgR family response regulator transcription factor [Candidatus Onthomonas sp.]
MLRVAVAEDNETYRDRIERYLDRYSQEHGLKLETTFFSNGLDLVQNYKPGYDIVLLDIMMPDMDGMEAAQQIRQEDERVVLIFITQMTQYAIQGYSVGALDYLLKPVYYETFDLKFTRAVERVRSRAGGQITLLLPGGMKRLKTQDIFYVEIQNHMLHYHTREGEYVLRGTMQAAEQELEPYRFAKCNHWYLVNLAHVTEVNKDMVTVAGSQLEISRRNRAAFLNAVTNYVGGNT